MYTFGGTFGNGLKMPQGKNYTSFALLFRHYFDCLMHYIVPPILGCDVRSVGCVEREGKDQEQVLGHGKLDMWSSVHLLRKHYETVLAIPC